MEKKDFKIDIAFSGVIQELFKQLDLSFIFIGIESEKDAKPEQLLLRKFKKDDVLLEIPAKLGKTGDVVVKHDTVIAFDQIKVEEDLTNKNDVFFIKHFPVVLFVVRAVTKEGNGYYTFNKIAKPGTNTVWDIKTKD